MSIFKIKFYFYLLPRLYISIIIEQLTNKFQVFVTKKKKNAQAYVNLITWVKPNELRQDHGWKSCFYGKFIYPFYKNILIKRKMFWKNIIVLWSFMNSYLNFCVLKIAVLLSNHENDVQTIFLPKSIASCFLTFFIENVF